MGPEPSDWCHGGGKFGHRLGRHREHVTTEAEVGAVHLQEGSELVPLALPAPALQAATPELREKGFLWFWARLGGELSVLGN